MENAERLWCRWTDDHGLSVPLSTMDHYIGHQTNARLLARQSPFACVLSGDVTVYMLIEKACDLIPRCRRRSFFGSPNKETSRLPSHGVDVTRAPLRAPPRPSEPASRNSIWRRTSRHWSRKARKRWRKALDSPHEM